jgi:hypothetical protein
MSAVIAVPELMAEAATDLATIGSDLRAAHMTAAPPTVALQPAAADEVSASIAHLFSGYGQEYQKLAGEQAASHEQFVQRLNASAAAYASAEAANTASLQPLTAAADSSGSGLSLVDWLKLTFGQGNMLATILSLPYGILFVAGAIAFAFTFFGLLFLLSLPSILFG